MSNTSTKVGLRLTSNIEVLPLAPSTYQAPPTYYKPKLSFAVANTYQNCGGMCFAVSMARTNKAFVDEFGVHAISLDLRRRDYLYSGTIVNSIPKQYFGYGVGGALALKGYATLVNEEDVWEGKLEEGAMIQYWNGNNLTEIINRIKRRNPNNPQMGHSLVFKAYQTDASGNIIGLKLYDYTGVNRTLTKGDGRLVLGANLLDF